jgi:hypothetical protein
MMKRKVRAMLLPLLLCAASAFAPLAHGAQSAASVSLAGTWTLVAADVKHADGSQTHDYGANPEGSLMVDDDGRYALQIFKAERTTFPMADKSKGTASDYQSAVMGSSTHYGTISVDQNDMTLTFHIQDSSFPDWKGQSQKRRFTLTGSELSYFGVPRPNGDVPISVWKRLQ